MRILVISDTHRKHENLTRVLERVAPIDLLIHLGDAEGCEDYIAEQAGCPMEIEDIEREAEGRGFDIVMFGHTHRPIIDYHKDIIAINPGSLSYPRQEGKRPSYIMMELDKNGDVHFEIEYL